MRRVMSGVIAVALVVTAFAPAAADTTYSPPPTYQADDYGDGQVMSVNPPGENGLVNAADLAAFQLSGRRPAASDDQLGQYSGLLYGYPTLADATLGTYYNDESFGIRPADVTRTEYPSPTESVVVYRDTHDIPHIYGQTDAAMAYGAGYAQAEDRLFLMDVLRHYGEGALSAFLGPSCADEQMDHDQLLLAPYTPQQAQAQVDALPQRYGSDGQRAKDLIDSYVAGVNAYIAQTATDPSKLIRARTAPHRARHDRQCRRSAQARPRTGTQRRPPRRRDRLRSGTSACALRCQCSRCPPLPAGPDGRQGTRHHLPIHSGRHIPYGF
jgi:Penicillin amidase